jgi:hypothetical protein
VSFQPLVAACLPKALLPGGGTVGSPPLRKL